MIDTVASLVTGCSFLVAEIEIASKFPAYHRSKLRAELALAVAPASGPGPGRAGMAVALESEQRGGKVAFTAGLPLLPLDSSEVVGAGTVLHSQHAATTAVQGVILCLVGLGSTKEK